MLQVRMNVKSKAVDLRLSRHAVDAGALQREEKVFSLGFDVDNAIALLRLDDLYIETFEIKDAKTPGGINQSRVIGRISDRDEKTNQ